MVCSNNGDARSRQANDGCWLGFSPVRFGPRVGAITVGLSIVVGAGGIAIAESDPESGLPDRAPSGFGLVEVLTRTVDEQPSDDSVAQLMNEMSASALRAWATPDESIAAVVEVTEVDEGIVAALMLSRRRSENVGEQVNLTPLEGVPDVFAWIVAGSRTNEVGTMFRRGRFFYRVIAVADARFPIDVAVKITVAFTSGIDVRFPGGDSSDYELPTTAETVPGLVMCSVLVSAAAGGSLSVSRWRARRLRRRWNVLPAVDASMVTVADLATVADLDGDAQALRRRGRIVIVGQLVAVNVGIVALAGDFGAQGVVIAAAALVAGLGFTRWWQRRELASFGPHAQHRVFVAPRWGGLVMGVAALAILALGVGFALKGLRYLVLPPTLAQLGWSERLSLSPRGVGTAFALGGFVVAVIGATCFRTARAFSRATTHALLDTDRRPAALYLRSFDDDQVPLPSIVSARRPLLELFTLRGTDPFEEAIAWELSTLGPVVAVGRPGRRLASLGAAREHLSDDSWMEQVSKRMDEAAIIAVATGETDGLAWELGHLVTAGHLGKTVFVFPPVAPLSNEARWASTAKALEVAGALVGPLPAPAGLVHTAGVGPKGDVRVTTSTQRDEASYRTAIDRVLLDRLSS